MKIEPMPLERAAVVQTSPFLDHRGVFARFFCEQALEQLLDGRRIQQINFSSNRRKGTVRGLHYQLSPHEDMKFVRCLRGSSFHVAVDIRPASPSYLCWHAVQLQAHAMDMLCIPEGCAHGFQSLEDDCELMYFVTAPYAPHHQGGLRYDDPSLGIDWPLAVSEISARDASFPLVEVQKQRSVA